MGLHRIESIMDGMTLILPTKLKYKISARAKSLQRRESSKPNYYMISPRVIIQAIIIISRRRLVLTPGSRMFHGPKKFLCSPIPFNERKSHDQVTQGKTYVGDLFT